MATVMSITVLAIIALVLGAVYLLRRGGARTQALLMLLLAAIAGTNVAIWAVPDASGEAPMDRKLR